MNIGGGGSRRRAIAGVVVMILIFAMLFTAGTGYLLFKASSDLSSYQANVQALQQRAQISQEQLAFGVKNLTRLPSNLLVTVNDTGGLPINVVSSFVEDNTSKVISPPLKLTVPLNLNVGGSGNFTLNPSYIYTKTSGIIYVALVTSRGNVFTQQYPLNVSVITSTAPIVNKTSLTGPGGGGGNSLVIAMSATPIQVYSGPCSMKQTGAGCITDNVTLYNYSPTSMTGVGLYPDPPLSSVTGTATLTNATCSGPYTPPGHILDSSKQILGYIGVGVAPHIYFLCTYAPNTGAVGGLASFSGWAFATQGTTVVQSASTGSNIVQIGGLTNVLAQGAFSTNFFFFKYSSCTNAPSGGSYSTKCTTNTPMPPNSPNNLPEGAVISGGSNYYVAFYIQITNNYNTTLPLLSYTFLQVDPSNGGETDWWLVGTNKTMSNGAYYPSYNPGTSPRLPTLTAYPSDCNIVNSKNVPTDSNCIYVNPGQTVTITFAACGSSSSNWDWGGTRYGTSWDSSSGCLSGGSKPDIGSTGDATAATTVISFLYKGQTLTEDIAFNGIAFTS